MTAGDDDLGACAASSASMRRVCSVTCCPRPEQSAVSVCVCYVCECVMYRIVLYSAAKLRSRHRAKRLSTCPFRLSVCPSVHLSVRPSS